MDYKIELQKSAKDIEMENYLKTIFMLSESNPEILYRVIEMAKQDNKNTKNRNLSG
ncbi:MAG TPA: hypothetical protein HA230_05010 [Candidatus Aenigmarchaeota archaeon]|nr:hypothetical protein [Candidatus Aenigmarchaeota archaeon]